MFEGLVATRAGSGLAATHRFLLIALWGCVPVLAATGLILDMPAFAVGLSSFVLLALALGGMTTGSFATMAVSLGLVAAAGVVVVYGGGATTAHFAFFLVIGAVSFYRLWQPLAAAVAAITAFHLVATTPGEALIHSLAIGALALLLREGWRLAQPDGSVPATPGDRFRIGFEEAPIGMAVVKPSGEILEVNKAMADMLGYPQDSLHTNISRLVHADDHRELGEAWEEMGNSPGHRATEWMRWATAHGHPMWGRVSLSLAPRNANQPALVILQLEDAGGSHEAQTQLETLLRDKDEFVAAVGDEISKPLGALIDLTDQAAHRHVDLGETLPRIEAHAREAASIVDDLVVSARAETTPVSVMAHQLDAEILCRDVASGIPGAEHVSFLFRATKVWADPTLARRIVAGLIQNAVKYGGPEIWLQTLSSGPDTVIQVTDNGPGMPDSERERMFSGDLRHGPPVTRPAAVGLSLTVGRDLARQMDGDIEYRRTGDGRNVFEIRLPSESFTDMASARPARLVANVAMEKDG